MTMGPSLDIKHSVLEIRAGMTPTACAASSTVALEVSNSKTSLGQFISFK